MWWMQFILLLTSDEFTVSVERAPPEFTVSVESNTNTRFLAKFTSASCGPCRTWDAKEKQKIIDAGFEVVTYDMGDPAVAKKYGDPKRGDMQVTSLPTFVICDRATGDWIEQQAGYVSAADLLQMLREGKSSFAPEGASAVRFIEMPKETAMVPMSHREMVSLHNRLHGGGSWTWPGDLASHLQTTHGVSTVKQTQPVQQSTIRYQQSACPGGRCPTPSRRRGLFGIFQ